MTYRLSDAQLADAVYDFNSAPAGGRSGLPPLRQNLWQG